MRLQTLRRKLPTKRPPNSHDGKGQKRRSRLPPAPFQIVIEPTVSGRKWIARLGKRVLCVSAWPFVKSARLLLDEGCPADAIIGMWRPNAEEFALRGRLGAVAATVIDGETTRRRAKNGSPVRDP